MAELREDGTVRTLHRDAGGRGAGARCRARPSPGGDAEENARRLRALLAGERSGVRTAVLLNAAAALVVVGRAATCGRA